MEEKDFLLRFFFFFQRKRKIFLSLFLRVIVYSLSFLLSFYDMKEEESIVATFKD